MILNIIFLKSEKDFSDKAKRRIKDIIKQTANHAGKLLGVRKNHILNFTIYPYQKTFVGGFTQAEDWIQVSIPQKKFKENELKGLIYHEMHHIVRGHCGYSKRKITFLDSLFSEGLATVFEMEQVPKRAPKYAKYTNAFIKKWLPELKKQNLLSEKFSYDEWFLGRGEKPKQLGYKIGIYLIHQIQKNFPELTLEKLTKKKAKELLKLSKIQL